MVRRAARLRSGWTSTLDDRTLETALIGVQGPRAQTVLQTLCPTTSLDDLAWLRLRQRRTVAGAAALVSRTGYTGEDGFEVMVDARRGRATSGSAARRAKRRPCGLGARDTLRTEAGFALYGHEIDETTNPYEARLGWVVSLAKPSFVGREALARDQGRGPAAPPGRPRRRRRAACRARASRSSRRTRASAASPAAPSRRRSSSNIAMGYVPDRAEPAPGSASTSRCAASRSAAEVVRIALRAAPLAATRHNVAMAERSRTTRRSAVHHRARVDQARGRALRRWHHRLRPGSTGRHRLRRAAQGRRSRRGGQGVRRHRVGQDRVRPVRARVGRGRRGQC